MENCVVISVSKEEISHLDPANIIGVIIEQKIDLNLLGTKHEIS